MGHELSELDEAQLIAKARDDPAAFAFLYECYVQRIYAYACQKLTI